MVLVGREHLYGSIQVGQEKSHDECLIRCTVKHAEVKFCLPLWGVTSLMLFNAHLGLNLTELNGHYFQGKLHMIVL